MGIRWRRHGVHDRRLCALRTDAAQWRRAGWKTLSQPKDHRLYGLEPYWAGIRCNPRALLPARTRLRIRSRFRGSDRSRREPDRGFGRRNELVRRGRHDLLDRPEGKHVRRLHGADRVAARKAPRGPEKYRLRSLRQIASQSRELRTKNRPAKNRAVLFF